MLEFKKFEKFCEVKSFFNHSNLLLKRYESLFYGGEIARTTYVNLFTFRMG